MKEHRSNFSLLPIHGGKKKVNVREMYGRQVGCINEVQSFVE